MKLGRKNVAIAAALLLIIPAIGWWALLELGYVGTPGTPIDPPFNLSDRIATIKVIEEGGEFRAQFDGWKEGDPELTDEEFFGELYKRQRDLPWIFDVLDVTSLVGVLWVFFGFAAQAIFAGRMIIQWRASEKAGASVVPPIFWWMSLIGSSMLMIYFIWRKEIVGFLGQSSGWFIYIRNLWFIYGKSDSEER